MKLPHDYSLLADLAGIRRDLAFVRAWRNARFLTAAGEIPLVYNPGALNATIDLRSITASGVVPSSAVPSPLGAGDSYLATDGAIAFWQTYTAETTAWASAVSAAGGTLAAGSKVIADTLIRAVQVSGFSSKIVYLLPLLGANLASARVPLRDTLGAGIATNSNFVDADFSQATGLQGNGVNKILNLLIKPGQLGSGSNGGYGYVENNVNISASNYVMGCTTVNGLYSQYAFIIYSGGGAFRWGQAANQALETATAVNGHYYSQRSSATLREIFFNGVSVATNTANDVPTGPNDRNIRLLGVDDNGVLAYNAGRCACAYLTDGTLTASEVATLHTLLNTYLITPTGR